MKILDAVYVRYCRLKRRNYLRKHCTKQKTIRCGNVYGGFDIIEFPDITKKGLIVYSGGDRRRFIF